MTWGDAGRLRYRELLFCTQLWVCSTFDGIPTSCLMCCIVAPPQNSPKSDYSLYVWLFQTANQLAALSSFSTSSVPSFAPFRAVLKLWRVRNFQVVSRTKAWVLHKTVWNLAHLKLKVMKWRSIGLQSEIMMNKNCNQILMNFAGEPHNYATHQTLHRRQSIGLSLSRI